MEYNLKEHTKNKHQQRNDQPRDRINSQNNNKNFKKLPCIYWNHGKCAKEFCQFAHIEIPACDFQDMCRNPGCTFYHFNKSLNTFLGRRQVGTQRRNQ